MLTAPTTFSELDKAIHRTRARYGYKADEWEALSDDERFEELAYDYYRQKKISELVEPFWIRLRDSESISSVEAFYLLELARI